jgi:hypothetical protein
MKVSAFTFIKNGQQLGYPFVQSIRSILPIVDEFIINVGTSNDDTLAQVRAIGDPKIKIMETTWNDKMRHSGFVYGQQKMMAQYACTGDWAFYLEGDEVVHEEDYGNILQSMKDHLDNPEVEALVFDYVHFYGNADTQAYSPRWYRRAPRVIKTSVRSYAPDGLFWVVLKKNKRGRYPKAALANAKIYHYGWVRDESCAAEKEAQISQYWDKKLKPLAAYNEVDPQTLIRFAGTHPKIMQGYYPEGQGIFEAKEGYTLSSREKRHRWESLIERILGCDLCKKHFKLVVKG